MDDGWEDLIAFDKTTYAEQLEKAEKRMKKAEETYNPIQSTIKQQYWKRNLTAKRWQAGNTPDTAFVIEKPNEKGEILHVSDGRKTAWVLPKGSTNDVMNDMKFLAGS